MKPLKSSKKLNPLGENMNLPDAFNQLKNTKHDSSFENLGEWLGQNTSKPKKMKSLYKIAASLIFATMILIACTVPVQHEEEIGYMIKGYIETEITVDLKSQLADAAAVKLTQLNANTVLHEEEQEIEIVDQAENNFTQSMAEIVLILPDADINLANEKKNSMAAKFDFHSIEVLPIEETVERPFYEAALHNLDIKVGKELSEEQVVERINTFLHENSSSNGRAKISLDEQGNRFVEIAVDLSGDNHQVKRTVERLYNELVPNHAKEMRDNMTKEELMELKQKEIDKAKAKKAQLKEN
ncbi:MAG: hypothetical protein ABJR05_17375 [Balneola sp.]